MAYVLKDRALPKGAGEEELGRCIFCGRQLRHFNGEKGKNHGFHVYAVYKGKPRLFYYCQDPVCPQLQADRKFEHSIWRCGCVRDYIENVGELCGHCKAHRDEAVERTPAGDDAGDYVHVYNARLIVAEPLGDGAADRLEEGLSAMLRTWLIVLRASVSIGRHERLVLDKTPVLVPAEDYDLNDWFGHPENKE